MAKQPPAVYEHFSTAELACPCGECDGGRMNPLFMERVGRLRVMYGKSMPIESAYRCTKHNAAIGGAKDGMHPQGRALDVKVPDARARYQLVRIAISMGCFGGIGINKTTVHIDDRNMAEAVMFHYYK